MNPYLQSDNTARNTFMNSPVNLGVRPTLNMNNSETTPVPSTRMQHPRSNETNKYTDNQTIYPQPQPQNDAHQNRPPNQQILPQQQQSNVPRDHLQQQHINISRNNSQQQNNTFQSQSQPQQSNREIPGVLPRQDSAKLQIDPTNMTNAPNRYHQSGGISFENQRLQMAPEVRFHNARQPIRPPLSNPNNVAFINQSPNYNNIETPKILNYGNRAVFQNDNPEDYKTHIFRGNPTDYTKNIDRHSFDGKDPSVNFTETASSKTSVRPQQESASNAVRPDAEIKPDLINAQATLPPPESKAEQNLTLPDKNEKKTTSESSEEEKVSSHIKGKEKSRKGENNNAKDRGITTGKVRKNIKFFEENDTARKPLTPTTATVKKRERVRDVPSDVVKSEFHENDYESGVDESPVVHPNLGNISQVPRKVARIPRVRKGKHIKRHRSEKIYKFKSPSKFVKCSHHTPDDRVWKKMKMFGSNEELLAFFESTKSWRKMNRYGKSATNQNAAKDKLVYKPTANGDFSPKKTPSKLPAPSKANIPASPTKTPLKSPGTPGAKSLPKTPETTAPSTPLIKKVPMNKIQVGAAPSPNLKTVRSKVGSLANTTHKPGGGNIKIETHKIDLSNAQPRIEAKNDQYKPSGGDKKIAQVKLQWSAKSKVGSLENATYKPGGGDKKIESVKLDFKEKAKPKVGSKDNVKHTPGGGNVKIENQKLEFKAQSKVGSLDNVKHKPGGGDIKIFDDKTYMRQVSGNCSEGRASGTQNYKDILLGGNRESRSSPGTPARKTTNIKIKKTITIQSFEEMPKIEKTTEVIVSSQTPKKDKKNYSSPVKQQVTLTYSKISSRKGDNKEDSVQLIKIPARSDAPMLKPNLSRKPTFDSTETVHEPRGNQNRLFDNYTVAAREEKYKMYQESVLSSGSPVGKSNFSDNSGMPKFLNDKMATQEKVSEMWQEMNKNKSILSGSQQFEGKLKEPVQTLPLESHKSSTNT